jgi:hypothetical protein
MQKNWWITLMVVGLAFYSAKGQHELGIFAGGTNFYGDVGPDEIYVPTDYAGGIFYRHSFGDHVNWRFSVNYGQISAADSLSRSEWEVNRNLSFRSKVLDFNTTVEFNFFPYRIGRPGESTFFLFVGIGSNTYNPEAFLVYDWFELRPLSTEGQGTSQNPAQDPYGRLTMNIPFGMGYKVNMGKWAALGFEVGLRRTFTDYLDDVSTTYVNPVILAQEKGQIAAFLSDRSLYNEDNTDFQRGNALNNDWFVFSGVTLTFKVFEHPQKCHKFR